jgi:hypothetical protein
VHEFWDLTPRETYAVIRAAEWRMEQAQRGRAWLAWHTAALSRARRLPSLRRLLGGGEAKELQGDELERRRQEHEELKRRMNVGR